MSDIKTCSICKKRFTEYGNNPKPFKRNSCCDQCNNQVVLPMRIFENQDEIRYAMLFKADGTLRRVNPKDEYFTLKELQSLVRGLIELYSNQHNDHLIVCNEKDL